MEQYIPNVRVSAHGDAAGFEDRDNFVRDLRTILLGPPENVTVSPLEPRTVVPVTKAKAAGGPVVPLAAIKLHLRIETAQTAEDAMLLDLEAAAHLHTQNQLRKVFDDTVGEHVKQAMLFLIAHWYRNRESVLTNGAAGNIVPMAYEAILGPERDYPVY